MVMPTMPRMWWCDKNAKYGDRIAQIASSVLSAGVLAEDKRLDTYRPFVACGFNEDISRTRTSCGIFVRACTYWAGKPTSSATPKIGKGLEGHPSWIDMSQHDGNFVKASLAAQYAVPGAVFLKAKPDHVGILIAKLPGVEDGWVTAEGGGGIGTECRITWRRLGDDFPSLVGIWLPDMNVVGASSPPAMPSVPFDRVARGTFKHDTVKIIQRELAKRGLYAGSIDGSYGPMTESAVKKLDPTSTGAFDAPQWKVLGWM